MCEMEPQEYNMSAQEYSDLQEESHYFSVLSWMVFYILEYGPTVVGNDLSPMLINEVDLRIAEGVWDEDMQSNLEKELQG